MLRRAARSSLAVGPVGVALVSPINFRHEVRCQLGPCREYRTDTSVFQGFLQRSPPGHEGASVGT